jgi:transcriptional regulator with GAF, ATPase, and Fis domain
MADQQRLIETLVSLADTLVDEYDVIDFMQTLAERSVELAGVSAAGIMLADGDGRLRHVACSSEQMRLVELLELQLEEGPCFDAFHRRAVVRSDTSAEACRRWPRFGPRASEGGFAAVSAVPLRLRGQAVGALNLFSVSDGALDDDDLAVVQAMADIATIGVLQARMIYDQNVLTAQLETALESRVIIEQAKGVVAERNRVDVDEAFALIRSIARDTNRLLVDTANGIVDGTLTDVLIAAGERARRASADTRKGGAPPRQ